MMSNGPLMLFVGFIVLVIVGVLCLALFKEDNENKKTKTNH